jgi:hypothetical protein
MRRIMLLVTVAATVAAMVVLTAAVAFAQGGQAFEEFCAAHNGEITVGPPTCTFTQLTPGIPAQHGFTLTEGQVVQVTIMGFNNGTNPQVEEVGQPTIVSCQNPHGKDVPLSNPNCRRAS